jgi:hypothetical protein
MLRYEGQNVRTVSVYVCHHSLWAFDPVDEFWQNWLVGWFLMPWGVIFDNLFWPLPTIDKSKNHLWGKGTHMADSLIPNDKVIMKMMLDKGDLQFNMGFKPWWRPRLLHFSSMSLTVVKASVCEQEKFAHRSEEESNPEHWMKVHYLILRLLGPTFWWHWAWTSYHCSSLLIFTISNINMTVLQTSELVQH